MFIPVLICITWIKKPLSMSMKHLGILSGLYGVLKPLDLIQPYRLEMGTKLKNARGDNLYEFWGEEITDVINARMADSEDKVLINLASNEYFKAVKKKALKADIITPRFEDEKEWSRIK